MSEPRYGPYEPPVSISDGEWRILEALRTAGTISQASTQLGLEQRQLRFLLANVAQKLAIAAKL